MKRLFSHCFLLLFVVLGCGGGSDTATVNTPPVVEEPSLLETQAEPVENIDPAVPLFEFGDEVSEEEREKVRNTTYHIIRFLEGEYGITLNRNLTVYAYVNRENFIEGYTEFHGEGATPEFIQHVNDTIEEERSITGRVAWGTFDGDGIFLLGTHIIADTRNLVHFIVHEYFHAIQTIGYLGSDRIRHTGPEWLVEGSARYTEPLALEYFDLPLDGFTGSYSRAAEIRAVSNLTASLKSMETWEGFFEAEHDSLLSYILGRLAAEYLADNYGGLEAIFEYYRSFDPDAPFSVSWREAFESTLGISIDDFYEEFEGYRQRGFEN